MGFSLEASLVTSLSFVLLITFTAQTWPEASRADSTMRTVAKASCRSEETAIYKKITAEESRYGIDIIITSPQRMVETVSLVQDVVSRLTPNKRRS